MPLKIAIIYNEPVHDRYSDLGEQKAIIGVLDEVNAVDGALKELGYNVKRFGLSPPIESVRQTFVSLDADVVFNLFEGFAGKPETEAEVAGMIEASGLCYTGCPPSALSLALDKSRTKDVLQKAGLPTPRFQVLEPATLDLFDLHLPCIVKPAAEDASHGLSELSVVNDFTSLAFQVKQVSELYSGRALVEEFIDGREFNATVIGNDKPVVLPVSEIVFNLPQGSPRILTFDAKWEDNSVYSRSTLPVCPADLDDVTHDRIAASASSAFQLLGCAGYARVDFRMGSDSIPQIIEVNPNPDISMDAGVARQARAAGMTYTGLIERIVQLALERRN